MKLEKFNCLKDGNCRVEIETRNLCKFCRLTKCYQIGMKKEMVLEKRTRKSTKRNGNSHPLPPSPPLTPSDEGNKSPSIGKQVTNPVSSHLMEEVIWRDLIHFEDFLESSSNSSDDVNTSRGDNTLAESDIMNQLERSLIEEINAATAAHFVEELGLEVTGEVATFKDGLNLPGVYIMHIIRFCKMLTPFRLLQQSDQMAILKPYFTELLLTRFTFAYSSREDSFPVYSNKEPTYALWMKVSRLEEVSDQLAAFAKDYRQFIIATQREMENDITIRNLLSTLLMFRHREALSNPEFLRYHYFVYQHLLHQYLLEKYNGSLSKADDKWRRLQTVLDEVCKFRVPICALYTLVEVQEVESVLTEIYDLGQQMDRMAIVEEGNSAFS